jgi:hypothetical protein
MKNYGKYIIATLSIITILVTLCFIPFNATRLIPMIEEQVANELGINIYIERLILRVGPYIKVKAPLMHIMYRDGQKFAQFDNVKFYLPWSVLVNNKTNINKIKANKLTVRVNSNDKYLKEFIDKLGESGIDNAPNATVKEYSITYFNVDTNNKSLSSFATIVSLISIHSFSICNTCLGSLETSVFPPLHKTLNKPVSKFISDIFIVVTSLFLNAVE